MLRWPTILNFELTSCSTALMKAMYLSGCVLKVSICSWVKLPSESILMVAISAEFGLAAIICEGGGRIHVGVRIKCTNFATSVDLLDTCHASGTMYLTWLKSRNNLNSWRSIAKNCNPFVLVVEILWPSCRVHKVTSECIEALYIREFPIASAVSWYAGHRPAAENISKGTYFNIPDASRRKLHRSSNISPVAVFFTFNTHSPDSSCHCACRMLCWSLILPLRLCTSHTCIK